MGQIYKCSRGFLIERQEDGKYTPFFVKVRVQDVVDDKGNMAFPSGGSSGGGGGGSSSGGSVSVKEVDGWLVSMLTTNYYIATKSFSVSSVTFTKNTTNDTELYANITIPYQVSNEFFNVDVGVSGLNDNIATANVNVTPLTAGSRVTGLKISIRNLIYTFPNDWNRDVTYENSKIYIRVSGRT